MNGGDPGKLKGLFPFVSMFNLIPHFCALSVGCLVLVLKNLPGKLKGLFPLVLMLEFHGTDTGQEAVNLSRASSLHALRSDRVV